MGVRATPIERRHTQPKKKKTYFSVAACYVVSAPVGMFLTVQYNNKAKNNALPEYKSEATNSLDIEGSNCKQ